MRHIFIASILFGCSSAPTAGAIGDHGTPIERICHAVGTLDCGESEQQCLSSRNEEEALHELAGCAAEQAALDACTMSAPWSCQKVSQEDRLPLPTARCDAQELALSTCLPVACGPRAGLAPETGTILQCTGGKLGELTAECTADCACTCTVGPRAGTAFHPSECTYAVAEKVLFTFCK